MKTVLFVCIHNSGRSQMAEAIFNQLAVGKAGAISAGTMPAQKLNPQVVQAMEEIGIDVSAQKPKLLTEEMLRQADRVITMGCSVEQVCPATLAPTEDWGLDDPAGKPIEKVRQIRDEVLAKVKGLLAEMPAKSQPSHTRYWGLLLLAQRLSDMKGRSLGRTYLTKWTLVTCSEALEAPSRLSERLTGPKPSAIIGTTEN